MPTPHPGNDQAQMNLSESEWRSRLSPEQFRILREKGTERAFTGKYWDTKTQGVYKCAGCGTVLFTSGDKFDSGCGWPSFDKMAKAGVVNEHVDTTHGMVRTEVTCAKCGGHLGHVFDDGPTDTGLRYCINSASIELDKQDSAEDQAPKK
ncbi:MAG TPA: peptide-methionine (R)-S-oxide reductase MsrB [Phycisphaerales bacterium]|nr:peptide-methionine (R)-S-oxide reductase MsrB [Phycisphaerales bacterium]